MTALLNYFLRNRDTFYDYRTNEKDSIWPRYTAIVLFSGIVAVLCGDLSDVLLSTLIPALAILAGFSFSTQFFLVDHKFDKASDPTSLEEGALNDKLDRISRELFDNVSYFNAVCLVGVVQCIILLLKIDCGSWPWKYIGESVVDSYFSVAPSLGSFFLIAIFTETMLTFYRITDRVNYLFRKIRRL